MGRFVETKLLFELLDEARVDAPCATGIIIDLNIRTAHVQACTGHGIGTFEASQHLIDRPAWRGLYDHEVEQHDTEQRRNH